MFCFKTSNNFCRGTNSLRIHTKFTVGNLWHFVCKILPSAVIQTEKYPIAFWAIQGIITTSQSRWPRSTFLRIKISPHRATVHNQNTRHITVSARYWILYLILFWIHGEGSERERGCIVCRKLGLVKLDFFAFYAWNVSVYYLVVCG